MTILSKFYKQQDLSTSYNFLKCEPTKIKSTPLTKFAHFWELENLLICGLTKHGIKDKTFNRIFQTYKELQKNNKIPIPFFLLSLSLGLPVLEVRREVRRNRFISLPHPLNPKRSLSLLVRQIKKSLQKKQTSLVSICNQTLKNQGPLVTYKKELHKSALSYRANLK